MPRTPQYYHRRLPETTRKSKDSRLPAERDHDRVLYSSAYRRLGGVTQVISADEGHVFHNRLTHSLQVSQVARRLGQSLERNHSRELEAIGGIDVDAAEAAGLAHDLGHPPFGHIAEDELNVLLRDKYNLPEGYEGNAQSFRIITRLALRTPKTLGLNLTRVTLNAVLKYPRFYSKSEKNEGHHKWGAYASEKDDFNFARELEGGLNRRSIEAEIMDWSDDVTYAVHDIEDFYRAGLIPLDRLQSIQDESERRHFFDGINGRAELLDRLGGTLTDQYKADFTEVVTGFPLDEPYRATPQQRSALRDFTSMLIGEYVGAFSIRVPASGEDVPLTQIDLKRERQVKMLKLLTWHYVIHNPSLATQQFGQRKMIRELLSIFHDAGRDEKLKYIDVFPFACQTHVRDANRNMHEVMRISADLLTSMTERQVVRLYQRLTGISLGSALDDLST